MTTRSAFLRARRPEHKQQRRRAILTAARELAGASGVREVTLGAVADAVGLAKSNISRYFDTREAIYLELLTEEWQRYAEVVSRRLGDVEGTEAAIVAVAEALAERPLFCDLLSQVSTSLEHNVSVPTAHAFKRAVYQHIAAIGVELARVSQLTDTEGAEIMAAAGGLAGQLYRAANPPPVLVRVYADDPDLEAARPQLLPTLVRWLSALAAGLIELRRRDPTSPPGPA